MPEYLLRMETIPPDLLRALQLAEEAGAETATAQRLIANPAVAHSHTLRAVALLAESNRLLLRTLLAPRS